MSKRVAWVLALTIFFWSSAFVGIRMGLHSYTPGVLALLRYIIASCCMGVIYFLLPQHTVTSLRDKFLIMLVGAIGIGFYNLTLNSAEVAVTSGMASFIISMSPVITSLLAAIFLREKLGLNHFIGLMICIAGVLIITLGQGKGLDWQEGLHFILLATVLGSLYTVMQKPFVAKYHAIEVTTYAIWGAAISMSFYFPQLIREVHFASALSTGTVVYLAVFPGAIGYLAWSYVLANIPASRAVTFLYFQPFIVILLGWMALNEIPTLFEVLGGIVTLVGVWVVNRRKTPLAVDDVPVAISQPTLSASSISA